MIVARYMELGANSEWVLNGPYLDKTLIRNKLVYDLARELNGWAPDTRFVELFVYNICSFSGQQTKF